MYGIAVRVLWSNECKSALGHICRTGDRDARDFSRVRIHGREIVGWVLGSGQVEGDPFAPHGVATTNGSPITNGPVTTSLRHWLNRWNTANLICRWPCCVVNRLRQLQHVQALVCSPGTVDIDLLLSPWLVSMKSPANRVPGEGTISLSPGRSAQVWLTSRTG